MADSPKNVAIYIDGSNFYFSTKKTFNIKLDIEKFCRRLTGKDNLIKINYYIAPVQQLSHPEMYAEQQRFFRKLKKIDKLKIVFGRLEKRKRYGRVYYVEKATDVNLALDLVLDAQDSTYEIAYLISNDGDFSGAVKAVKERFSKEIVYVAIGTKKIVSHHLKKVSSSTLNIDKKFVGEVGLDE